MTSDMRGLIDSFDAHRPAVRPADDAADENRASEDSDQPSDAAHSGTRT